MRAGPGSSKSPSPVSPRPRRWLTPPERDRIQAGWEELFRREGRLTFPAAARIFRKHAKRPFSRATIYRFLTLQGWTASHLWTRERRVDDGTVMVERLTTEALIHPLLEDPVASRSSSTLYRQVHADGWIRGGRIWLPADGTRAAA